MIDDRTLIYQLMLKADGWFVECLVGNSRHRSCNIFLRLIARKSCGSWAAIVVMFQDCGGRSTRKVTGESFG